MNTTTTASTWSDDIERVLEAIRVNSIALSNHHKVRYYHYKSYLKYFKLPLIALSSLNSIASIGLVEYMEQKTVSLITCILSLLSATIASVELYLGIQKNMETEMITSRNYMLLAYDIYKTLSLHREHRIIDGKHYLDEKYNDYIKLVENANLIKSKHIKDAFAQLPEHSSKLNNTPNITSPYKNSTFLSPPPLSIPQPISVYPPVSITHPISVSAPASNPNTNTNSISITSTASNPNATLLLPPPPPSSSSNELVKTQSQTSTSPELACVVVNKPNTQFDDEYSHSDYDCRDIENGIDETDETDENDENDETDEKVNILLNETKNDDVVYMK